MSDADPYRSKRLAWQSDAAPPDRCPACLSSIRGEPRQCATCGAPIATVRCGECYHMNLPSAALCTGCGHGLGLEPLPQGAGRSCPDCKSAMQRFEGLEGCIDDCDSCGGQFVEHTLLTALLERRELAGQALPRKPARHNPLETPVRYLPCPDCQQLMTRKNFGQSSGVIVDICAVHGMWFDLGELPRILSFVEAGGLVMARARADAERNRARAQQVQRAQQDDAEDVRQVLFTSGGATAVAEAGVELLTFVAELLGRR